MEHATVTRTELVSISSVSPHPQNARKGNVARIEESLRAHGQFAPIVVHEPTGYIIKGNNTFRVMRDKLGAAEVLASFVSCSEAQARAILAVDNRTSDGAEYDDAALALLLDQVNDEGWLAAAGYDTHDLDDLMALLQEQEDVDPDPFGDVANDLGVSSTSGNEATDGESIAPGSLNRMMILNYAAPIYVWVQQKLEKLCAEWELDTSADMVLALIAEAANENPPEA